MKQKENQTASVLAELNLILSYSFSEKAKKVAIPQG